MGLKASSSAVVPTPRNAEDSLDGDRLAALSGSAHGRFKTVVGNTEGATKTAYVLAPDVEITAFEGFINDASAVVGTEHVVVNVDEHSQGDASYEKQPKFWDFFALEGQANNMASAAIQPSSTQEVSDLVKLANKYKVSISPVSIGRNLGYGGTSPRLRGAVIIDLKRMNKILEVNEESAYCNLEPGVSYFDLYEHLQKTKSGLWVDVPDIGWGSVVGNATERGAGYTPYGDHFMFHCGMEVVLPEGQVVRTGMGAMPGPGKEGGESCSSSQIFQYGFGPYHDGIFSQSNFGIVTKMGFWLMPNPGGYKPFLITVPKHDDIHELVERIRPLRNRMIIQNAPTIRHVLLDAACMKSKRSWHDKDEVIPDSRIEEIAEEMNIGVWNFYGALYGPPPVQDGVWSAIWGSLSQIKGAKAYFENDVGPDSILHSRAKTLNGVPNLLELDWISWVPNGAHCFFSPISPVTGDDAVKQWNILKKRADQYGFDAFNTFIVGLREMHTICCLVFNKNDPEEAKRMHQCILGAIEDAASEGYGEYRTHNAFMDPIAKTYSWNDNALQKLNDQLKDSLDPNGILAPGKSGVWPARYRNRGF